MSEKIKVRFAPSPTGYLHIGGARTALFNWLFARSQEGEFILRIEDTDKLRSKKEYEEEILESLKWLGINWDKIYYQSQRIGIYREYAQKLLDKGLGFHKEGAIFFKLEFKRIEIDDLIRGKIAFQELPKQEEVIIKSDGRPTYNFACVVDDALMGVNYVIRGEDHISNTPKQILLYEALGFKIPEFAHLPLILSPEGGRLSKRFGATSIREYREDGYLPEALVNYLLLLGWAPGNNQEIISLEEAKKIFKIEEVNKTGAQFSLDKLNWVNSQYIRKKTTEELAVLIKNYLHEASVVLKGASFNIPGEFSSLDYLKKIASLFKERIQKLSDIKENAYFCFFDDYKYSPGCEDILKKNLSKEVEILIGELKKIEHYTQDNIERVFRKTAEELNLKTRELVHPTRVALTGKRVGPGLFETMEVLGKNRVEERLKRLLDYWKIKLGGKG